ncbi:hypothetical protein IAS59_005776 [Cryptococcus gattii]
MKVVSHQQVNLLNLLELPQLSTEHYTTNIAVIDELLALCETMSLCILTIYQWPLQDMFNRSPKKTTILVRPS